jgi:hypothetical protein
MVRLPFPNHGLGPIGEAGLRLMQAVKVFSAIKEFSNANLEELVSDFLDFSNSDADRAARTYSATCTGGSSPANGSDSPSMTRSK